MVSHVPFLDLNTVMKDKRMTIIQFILCVLTFFMRFRLSVQNSFQNSSQHSTTELGQKGYLSMIFQMLFKKNVVFFLDIIEQFGTRPRRRNTIILCWSRVCCLILTVEIHMLVCVYSILQIKCHQEALLFEFVTLIRLMVTMLLH